MGRGLEDEGAPSDHNETMLLFLACLPDPSLQGSESVDVPDQEVAPSERSGQPTALSIEDYFEDHPPDESPEEPDCPNSEAFPVHPWDLNVVVLGDLGSPGAPYTSDFQGAAAVLGEVHVSSFSLNALGMGQAPLALYAGARVQVQGSLSGGAEVAGDMVLLGASVDGDLQLGASLDGTGTVNGQASLEGQKLAGNELHVVGEVVEGVPFAPTVDLVELAGWFESQSLAAAALPTTTGVSEIYGELVITLQPGLNVVEVDAEQLEHVWGVRVVGNGDLILDVRGEELLLDGMVWQSEAPVLLNAASATRVSLSGGDHRVALLAPWAQVEFPSGLLTGNLVAASLIGGGQVNEHPYEGPELDCEAALSGGPQ